MSDDPEPSPEAVPKLQQTVAEVHWDTAISANIYANMTAVTATPWDFSLFFGQVSTPMRPFGSPLPERTILAVEPVVAVRLSPAAAVQLLEFLTQQISQVETVYGPIGRFGTVPPVTGDASG